MLTNAQLGSALWELRRAESFLHRAQTKADERYYKRRIRSLENYIETGFDELERYALHLEGLANIPRGMARLGGHNDNQARYGG